jgi:lipopolysaccharide export system protein LptC
MASRPGNLSRNDGPPELRSAHTSRHHVDWAVRARTTVNDAKRYTRFVGIMKRVLLVIVAALLLAVLAYALQPRDTKQYAMTFERLGHVANDLAMLKPRLMGTDSDGSPFVVTAATAVQDPHNMHRAHLSNVEADLSAKDGAWYNLNAPHGFLDTGAQKLWLDGKLALYSNGGYELHTDAAFVDLAPMCDANGKPPPTKARKPDKPKPRCSKTTIIGNHEVKGQGPFGTMRADRFHVVKASRHVYLDGHVRMVLYPAHATKPGKAAKKA